MAGSGPWTWLAALVASLILATASARPDGPAKTQCIWWEAEAAEATNFPDHTWLTPPKPGEVQHLSGGNWLANAGKRERTEAYARYTISVPHGGRWELWARKFWLHGPFRWRFDDQEWTACGRDVTLADHVDLREDVCVNWVYLGAVELEAGRHRFQIRLLAQEGEDLIAAFDCFALCDGPFVPNGKWKPGVRSGLAEDGWFAYEPQADPFTPDALLDLRSLNETRAGESGFVGRTADGQFALGDGTPVRFWAVNVSPNMAAQPRGSLRYLARKLAKLGVNMVRVHGPIFDPADPRQVDARTLGNLCALIAALEHEGIYLSLSIYFPHWLEAGPAIGLPGYEAIGNRRPFGMWFFDPTVQALYRGWMQTLLCTVNPDTGLTLASDPAVAMVELVNEDSLFFWTFDKNNIPPRYWTALEQRYGAWLVQRYGSLDNAFDAWGGAREQGDDAQATRVELYQSWWMTGEALQQFGAAKRRRVADQVRFLAEVQRLAYVRTSSFVKDDLQFGGLVVASNWKVSDPARLEAVEHYTYTAGDVIDRHGYFGSKHEGNGAGYSVRVGHTYADRAAVRHPTEMPVQLSQVAGWPSIISELCWPNPNRYRAEATFLAATYGSLQSIDGVFFFALSTPAVRDTAMTKFAVGSPVVAGTFPATALLYRRGDVAEGPPAHVQTMSVEDVLLGADGGPIAAAGLDPLRAPDAPRGGAVGGNGLEFFVGPVIRDFGNGTALPSPIDPMPFIDAAGETVRSATGEVRWEYGRGLLTVNAPRCQGATGFLAEAGTIELDDVAITCGNEFGSILVISLDERPLRESNRVLVQTMTEERPYGFRAAKGVIADLGGSPFNIRAIDAGLVLRFVGAGSFRVIVLDEDGYATDRTVVQSGDGIAAPLSVTLPADAVHCVVERLVE